MEQSTLETRLLSGELDGELTTLYGAERLEDARSRCAAVLSGFAKTFECLPEALFSAPGRTELGGNHTDHQHGRVLAAAVNLDILAAAAPNQSGMIRVQSEGYPLIVVDLKELTPKQGEENTSAALIRGVAARMAALGCPLQDAGLDAYIVSNVPGGSGLSSSAAFEVLIGTMLNALFWNGKSSAVEIAQIGQYAENVFFGKPCGLMDQTASSVGGVVAIDFADTACPVVESIALDLHAQGYALCILDSGAGHADLTGEYAAITDELKAVSRHFGKEVLREVPEADFLRDIGCSVTYFDRPKDCRIEGDAQVTAVVCDGERAAVDGVFLLRPTVAPTDLFPGLAVENGYVSVDRRMNTNLPGLFAAGDCTGGPLQVSKAVGEGLIAGQSAAAWAVAQSRT